VPFGLCPHRGHNGNVSEKVEGAASGAEDAARKRGRAPGGVGREEARVKSQASSPVLILEEDDAWKVKRGCRGGGKVAG
jgi:hypothetical protein